MGEKDGAGPITEQLPSEDPSLGGVVMERNREISISHFKAKSSYSKEKESKFIINSFCHFPDNRLCFWKRALSSGHARAI